LDAAEQVCYPVILRSAFTLGGLGSGFANNPDELRDLSAKSLSLSPQVLIEQSMKGWKDLEYEVVPDGADIGSLPLCFAF
jgi:carbamoyl-phosphate synthase large subunit